MQQYQAPLKQTPLDPASNIVEKRVARPATSVAFLQESRTFLIKAYDKAGNPSDNAGYVVVPASALPVLGDNITQTETNNYNTTGNTNITVNTSAKPDEITINNTSAAAPTGTYTFGGDLSGSQDGKLLRTLMFQQHER